MIAKDILVYTYKINIEKENKKVNMEFNKPENLKLSGNIAENFKLFKDEIIVYFEATETTGKSEKIQVARLLNLLGSDGLQLYRSIKRSDDEKETVGSILAHLENYCIPKINEIMEHFKFFTRKQLIDEKIDKYYAELRILVKTCNFGTIEDNLLRSQIVLGVANKELQTRLLRDDLTLDKVIKLCQAVEQDENNSKLLDNQSKEIDVIEQHKKGIWNQGNGQQQGGRQNQNSNWQYDQEKKFNCSRCGKQYKIGECPAYGKKLNHECESNEIYKCLALNEMVNNKKNYWNDYVEINNVVSEINIDTGAQINAMPVQLYKFLDVELKESHINIKPFGGTNLKPIGKVHVVVRNKCIQINTIFVVVEYDGIPILGYKDCKLMKYINEFSGIQENFLQKYKFIFTGINCFPDKVKIKVKQNSTPIINSPTRIPIKQMEKLKELLGVLCSKQIIEKTKEPSEWQNKLILIEKRNNLMGLCLDSRDLNKSIIRERVGIPTLDEVRNKLMNKKMYTLVNLKDGFYSFKLENESKQYCAFTTPYGTYHFNRLPFGAANTPEIFQQITNKYFGNIQNVCVYINDILIYGKTIKEHDEALEKVMQVAEMTHIKFNPDKIQYRNREIKYLGLKFSEKGIESDENRIKSIVELKRPTNVKELRSILGKINYLRSFIPNMANIVEPMKSLLRKDSILCWSEHCESAFNRLKEIVTEIPILANYDAKDQFKIQFGATKQSIWYCLFQENRPIYFESYYLNITQQGYTQIEKEMLSIKFACMKFHDLIYGQDVITVHTNYQPLIPIMNKKLNIIHINNRVEDIRLSLMIYNLNVEYCPGKYLYVTDLLSRNDKTDEALKDIIHPMEIEKFSNNKENEFKNAILEDSILQFVEKYLKEGWPGEMESLGDIRYYHKIKNELMLKNGLIYYGCRLVVPKAMRKYIITKLHETHIGTNKILRKSKQIFYWPGMESDITNFISACETCIKFSPKNV